MSPELSNRKAVMQQAAGRKIHSRLPIFRVIERPYESLYRMGWVRSLYTPGMEAIESICVFVCVCVHGGKKGVTVCGKRNGCELVE
jgi:hypothetical protein